LKTTSSTGQSFPNDKFTKIASAAIISGGSSSETGYSFLSYFTRANYKLSDKYLLGASVRVDGSSRFGDSNRYGVFPAVSAGWILSEENFIQKFDKISFLKLRASYGTTGNSEIGNFSSLTLYSSSPYADQSGIVPSQIGVEDLRWEKSNKLDLGLDFGFFNNRISGEIDYFESKTKDLLLSFPLPASNGFTSIVRNVGTLENKGWEFVLNTNNLVGKFKWNTSLNISTYKNKIVGLGGSNISGGSRQLGRISEGEAYGYFYGPKYAGVNPDNGNAMYYNADGEAVDQADYDGFEQKVGDPNPEFYGGINNKFTYKGFDLDIQTQFVYGNDLYNIAGFFQSVNGDYFDNQSKDQMNYWKTPGQITNIPQPRLYDGNGAIKSSRWVQDGSYFRVKNVVLGYTVPKSFLSKYKIDNARIYVAAQNLFTFTKYEGYDPEVNATYTGGVNLGHDFYTPPQAKTISFGVNIGF
jgi:TonB-linked SusC/RagA family outer membrane protein